MQSVSYNQPKFCQNASWNPNATTFADNNTIGMSPSAIFINTNNTVYVPDARNNRIVIWSEGNNTPTENISVSSLEPDEIFVTTSGDIYIETSNWNWFVVSKWTLTSTTGTPIMYACQICSALFVDISNTLYCSMGNLHQVVTQSLNSGSNTLTIVAGTGIASNAPNMLNQPQGIFVDINFDLYVADTMNNRIQRFTSGQLNATTVAGNTSSQTTFSLNYPTSIVLDADKYLFIADRNNDRIVGSGPTGFRCIVGCSGQGSAANQLSQPWSLSFDSYGNIFVTDTNNNRIQKFILMTNLCGDNTTSETTTSPILMETTSNFLSTVTDGSNNATINPLKLVSYNQPRFDQYASWSANAITFATNSTVGSLPYGIFVDTNNAVYAAYNQVNGEILIWRNNSINPKNILSGSLSNPFAIFVTINGDIYVDNGYSNGQVDKWIFNTNTSVIAMYVGGRCFGLFVDLNNVLYCSMTDLHQVVAKSLNSASNAVIIVAAGTGCIGSSSNMLYQPHGIFVDISFDLYVADSGNNRIQLFRPGQLNATSVAGNGSSTTTITLSYPTGIVLDADKYLFIVDSGNNRIVRSGPNGFQCIVGCYSSGSASNQLNSPQIMAFDSAGNIFVTDYINNRIQKFIFINYTLPVSYNQPKFNSSTTWNPDAITLSDSNIVGTSPYGIFVDTNNSVYVTDCSNNQIQIWFNGASNYPPITLYGGLSNPYSIFVTINGDIYVYNGNSNGVDKYASTTYSGTFVMSVSSECYGLFVDISNTLYCSMAYRVVKIWLDDTATTPTTVAGTGSYGSASNELSYPNGIFVDTNFDLYVADSGNNRIQLFQSGQLNGATVAGSGSLNTTSLYYPTGIVLDADNYLFIVDSYNNRIVRSGPNGFQCIVGCNGGGPAPNQLYYPQSMAFDSHGNIFVTDRSNSRVQKFVLATNLSDNYTAPQSTMRSTTTEKLETTSMTDTTTKSDSFSKDSTPISSTEPRAIENASHLPFVAPTCPDQNTIGANCNTSSVPCDILKPCQNNGTCNNTNTTANGYVCTCPSGFDGDQCQIDNRPCKPTTCWNDGTCNVIANTTFVCSCQNGWTGDHCQSMVNYCDGVKCENNGVCRPLFLNYTCVCLGTSYSGRHCEIVATSRVIRQTVSRSFAYIAILCLVLVISFFVIMDILKYCFGIDPAKDELEKLRRAKALKRAQGPPVIQRFVYVDAPRQRPPTAKYKRIKSNLEETIV